MSIGMSELVGRPRKSLTLIYGPLLHYRVPLFNALAINYDLRVFATSYSGDREALDFELCIIPPRVILGFELQPGLRKQISGSKPDACIVFLDLYNLSALSLIFFPIAARSITWGAWKTRSRLANVIRAFAVKRSDAAVFYCHDHLKQFSRAASDQRLFVAPNTVLVPADLVPASMDQRKTVVFVGSFTARKGLDRLLRIFSAVSDLVERPVKLVLVGDGPERKRLESLVREMGLSASVELKGSINDPGELGCYYREALAAISLNQAGLSVLQSMGFGVPFVTLRTAVSGGETSNIVDGVNGFLLPDDDAAITECLTKLCSQPKLSTALGRAARAHYLNYATIENYAEGISDAIEGTRGASVWQS